MVVKQPGALQVGTDNDAPEEGHAYGGPRDGGGEDDGLVGDKEVSLDALFVISHEEGSVDVGRVEQVDPTALKDSQPKGLLSCSRPLKRQGTRTKNKVPSSLFPCMIALPFSPQ